MFESILCQVTEYDSEVLESLIELAVSSFQAFSRFRAESLYLP
jgi:hypothetical protein